ncbi:hypothetical protein C8F01DRAFT_753831 [Mycena amicta]|nr:hypothetical protein C8F01DRAFT_753831 [Mycena amicta]
MRRMVSVSVTGAVAHVVLAPWLDWKPHDDQDTAPHIDSPSALPHDMCTSRCSSLSPRTPHVGMGIWVRIELAIKWMKKRMCRWSSRATGWSRRGRTLVDRRQRLLGISRTFVVVLTALNDLNPISSVFFHLLRFDVGRESLSTYPRTDSQPA